MPTTRKFQKLLFVLLVIALFAPSILAQRRGGARGEAGFRFRFVGPVVGNRIAAVAGIAGDPSTYYAGAASGGVWKSTDGGNRWDSVFDDEPVAAIGALAVAPSENPLSGQAPESPGPFAIATSSATESTSPSMLESRGNIWDWTRPDALRASLFIPPMRIQFLCAQRDD
jgi:hypothetical protein